MVQYLSCEVRDQPTVYCCSKRVDRGLIPWCSCRSSTLNRLGHALLDMYPIKMFPDAEPQSTQAATSIATAHSQETTGIVDLAQEEEEQEEGKEGKGERNEEDKTGAVASGNDEPQQAEHIKEQQE